MRSAILLSLLSGMLIACSTRVPLRYVAPREPDPRLPMDAVVTVGQFTDERGVDGNWLGAIRGDFGEPVKRLYTEKPVGEAVESAFAAALAAQGLAADAGQARYRVAGHIRKLDCSQYVTREAHAHLDVSVIHVETGETVHERLYQADRSEGSLGTGIFGSVDGLRSLAERTLTTAIDQVLRDPDFASALVSRPEPAGGEIAERLRQLEALRSQGLVDEDEYEAKRREILDAL